MLAATAALKQLLLEKSVRTGTFTLASGKQSDVIPPPYAFTCSEKVFVGASAD